MDKQKIIESMADVIHQESCCTSWADAKKMSRISLKALCKELPEPQTRTVLQRSSLYKQLKSWGEDD